MSAAISLPYFYWPVGSLDFEDLIGRMAANDPGLAAIATSALGLNDLSEYEGPERIAIARALLPAVDDMVAEVERSSERHRAKALERFGRLRERLGHLVADHQVAPTLIEAPLTVRVGGERRPVVDVRLRTRHDEWMADGYLLGVVVATMATRLGLDQAIAGKIDGAGMLDVTETGSAHGVLSETLGQAVTHLLSPESERELTADPDISRWNERTKLEELLELLPRDR